MPAILLVYYKNECASEIKRFYFTFITSDWIGKRWFHVFGIENKPCRCWCSYGIALRDIPQNTPIIYVWRLPSLVCEHISYAAWCFSVTCFYNISLLRAWLTNGIESLICPLLFFSLIIDFVFVFFNDLLEWYITQKKKQCAHIVEVGDADGRVERPIDLSKWHWPCIYLSIDRGCWTDVVLTVDGFFLNNTFIGKSEKGNPCNAKTKGIVFSFKL